MKKMKCRLEIKRPNTIGSRRRPSWVDALGRLGLFEPVN